MDYKQETFEYKSALLLNKWRELGATQLLLGVTSTMQCIAEIPFFLTSGWFLKKVGHMNMVSIAFLAFSLRFFGYFMLVNPWLTLPIELLQGLCFACYLSAITSYAKIVAPDGAEATMQGLVGGLFEGIGVAVGSLIGGAAVTQFKTRTTFGLASMIALCAAVVHASAHKLLDVYENKQKQRNNEAQVD